MTPHQIIMVTFVSVIALIFLSARLMKTRREGRAAGRPQKIQEAKKVHFELKGDIFELNTLAVILEDLERYGVPVRTIFELNIILEEVFVSIVNHQKEDQPEKKVRFSLLLEPGRVTARVRDHNEEFNPIVIRAVDLNAPIEEISFQGLGFHLVRHLADDVGYQRLGEQNILTLRKEYKAA